MNEPSRPSVVDHEEDWLEENEKKMQKKEWEEMPLEDSDKTLNKFTRNFRNEEDLESKDEIKEWTSGKSDINLYEGKIPDLGRRERKVI